MQRLLIHDIYEPPNDSPAWVALNYSGGRQSHAIARMLLRGEIEIPERFVVVAADPGNEHRLTYVFRDELFAECRERNIPCYIADGPKMLEDLEEKKRGSGNHLDQPANWVGTDGQLPQHCTRHYKIRPMNRAVWSHIYRVTGQRKWPSNSLERWIGFAWDERGRKAGVKLDDHRQQVRCPLIDLRMTKQDVLYWYESRSEPMPPPSVCNHCWANGTDTFSRIHRTDKEGWRKAKRYDSLARDLRQFGVKLETYCSKTRLSLQELEDCDFKVESDGVESLSCDSGHCFL